MISVNITNFRKNIFNLLDQAIKYNEPMSIETKNGKAIVISEESYNGLKETLYLSSIPKMEEKIIEGLKTPTTECLSENEVIW